jgi:KDO2-lipid IV(A) lauroyltransferase
MRAQVPLHPLEMFRTADAAYVLRIHPPLFFTKSGKFAEDLLRYSQQCQDIIESFVRAHPEQWLWLHRRWKKNARLEAEWEKRMGQLQRART